MRDEDYNLMHALEAGHWWFTGMREVTSALLSRYAGRAPRDILDVGCGTGINLLWMAQQFRPERVAGCDFSPTALRWSCETMKSARSYSRKVTPRLCRGDARRLPFAAGSFDMVTCLDVLDLFAPGEDCAAMAELCRVLRPEGIALVREPAYQWLISSHDYLFETRHRYTASELKSKMSDAGFEVLRTTYANTVLFPAAMVQRLLRKLLGVAADKTDTQPWPSYLEWLNGVLKACLHLEALRLARGSSLPFGLSAIAIGRKPA